MKTKLLFIGMLFCSLISQSQDLSKLTLGVGIGGNHLFKDIYDYSLTTNIPHISGQYNLAGANGFHISSSNTIRNQPFGWGGRLPSGGNPIPHNPVDILNVEDSNAQLIALNTDATNRLLTNDVRKKYFQVGATWSSKFKNNQQAGTIRLSNSTMETYTQAISNNIISTTGAGLNCFSCHNAGFGVIPFQISAPKNKNLSHVFGKLIAP